MKKSILIVFTIIAISILLAFTTKLNKSNNSEIKSTMCLSVEETWYICVNCCKTKKAATSPWENGCKNASSGIHNYSSCGKAGEYNYTCRNCGAEIYLTPSTSPSASTCCGTNKGSHSWYHH